jgi:tetratricopeptide (TPR) repeat protein
MKSLLSAIVLFFLFSSFSFADVKTEERDAAPSFAAYYYFILGYQAALTHDWEEALGHYRKALELDPDSVI